jgi:hypothetical protein
MNREELLFRYYFSAGLNKINGNCDEEGTDVYQNGHYVGSIARVLPSDLSAMEDDKLEEVFIQNNILL